MSSQKSNRVEIRNLTMRFDMTRGFMDGILFSLSESIFILIAVQFFEISDSLKSLIAASPFIGNILSLFYSSFLTRSGLRASTLASVPMIGAATFLAAASSTSTGFLYALFVSLAAICSQLRIPFLSSIYARNYDKKERGRLFSWSILMMIFSSLSSGFLFGYLLDLSLNNYIGILRAGSIVCLVISVVIYLIPSAPPNRNADTNPLRNLGYLIRDKIFGYMIAIWFLFGLANLWIRPLRIVYLAEAERGLSLPPSLVILISVILPDLARIAFTRFWATMFDKVNFIKLRIILNLFFACGILMFFVSESVVTISIGAFLQGVGFAGGGIAWNLWVTRYAPLERSHIYMSIHTFSTGIRGFIGPYLGFLYIRHFPLESIGFVSASVILVSCLLLIPLIKSGDAFQK